MSLLGRFFYLFKTIMVLKSARLCLLEPPARSSAPDPVDGLASLKNCVCLPLAASPFIIIFVIVVEMKICVII